MSDTLENRIVTARKNHQCPACGLLIEKGTSYQKSVLVEDGYFFTWRLHIPCHKLAMKLYIDEDCWNNIEDYQTEFRAELKKIEEAEHD